MTNDDWSLKMTTLMIILIATTVSFPILATSVLSTLPKCLFRNKKSYLLRLRNIYWRLKLVFKSCVVTRYIRMVKGKVKCTLVQALRLCTGRTAHMGSRGIALLRLCIGRTAHKGSRGIALLRLCTGRTAHTGSRGIALL